MKQITIVDTISRKDFYDQFVKKGKPVLIKNQTKEWAARELWTADYFKNLDKDPKVSIKTGDVSKGNRQSILLSRYVDMLLAHEQRLDNGELSSNPPYLHDVPIFHILPELIKDIKPFPIELFPKWYWDNWQDYVQFFMGPSNSLTPLHFDTLCTHNMFFQMVGSKKFILVEKKQKDLCYIKGWRWAQIDATNPDLDKFPNAEKIETTEVIVNAGDILYMPPGLLHQVHGLDYSISFNIDWHTTKSATEGVLSYFKGAPLKNMYYNALVLAGLLLKVPERFLFRFYKSYLNYVS